MEHSEAKISNKRSKCKKSNSHESSIENKSDPQNNKQTRSSTEEQLCQNKFYEECPSSAITDTVYTAGVSGMNFWEFKPNSLNGGKDFSSGRVELQIRDRFDLTDFAEVAYQTKEVIAEQFGEQTLKLHYALAAIAFRKPKNWNTKITVSAAKLLADFGKDKKKRQYISKTDRTTDGKINRYFSKDERLLQIAHQAYLLKRLEVWVREWKVRHKSIFSLKMSNLWDIYSIEQISQKNLYGDDSIIDIEITYSPGSWFEKFAGHEYLREFGYLTGETLKLDPYKEIMALRIAYFALFALQQNKSGHFQIENLLQSIGYVEEIEIAKVNGSAAFNLKRSFDRGIKTLAKFEHPYTFVYDDDIPEWICPDSKIKKPRHWFNNWLQCFGTLNQPEIKPKSQLRETDTFQLDYPAHNESNLVYKSISNTDLSIFGNQIKKARKANRESLRTMAKQLDISPSRLSQIENGCYPHPVNSELKIQLLTYLGLEI
jgi:DNA-binding XRE family transcriptional regulator